ncbi:sperm acrosome membrane-associated 6 [Sigmodon hispidus]
MALVALVGSSVLLFPLIFRASTWACLFCFTTHEERLRVCQMFVGIGGSKLGQCRDEFISAFEIFSNMEINYDERSHLHDAFTQMTLSLQDVAAAHGYLLEKRAETHKSLFEGGLWEAPRDLCAAAKLKRTIQQLKKVQDCIPPCGVQEVTRRFHCAGCFSTICDLPLDCPVQDVTVNRGDQALFSCTVGFQLPESELTYSWKFAAGGIRTQDVSYFRDVPGAHGYLARIRPVQPTHRGTFSCVILHDQRPLARLYFYLNVTGPPAPGETELQVTFREVMRWASREAEVMEPWRPSLGELLARPGALTLDNLFLLGTIAALVSASVIVLV